MRRYCWLIVLLVSALICGPRPAVAKTFDRPAVVVGDKIILESELQGQMQVYALQSKDKLTDPAHRAEVREQLIRRMIDDLLILAEAEKDTTIVVETGEVEQALAEHIENLRAQFPSDDAFEEQLQREGFTLGELRRRYRQDSDRQLRRNKLINKKLGKISVTNGEVREFYSRYGDSLPDLPAQAKLAHILLSVVVDTNRILAAREKMTGIRAEIEAGADFAAMARRYSDDPSGEVGGELGWFGPGDLVGEFETAVYKTEPGRLSGLVRSPFGFHLIEVEEKAGDRFRARHILLQLVPNLADTAAAEARADSLLVKLKAGADFCELVRDYTTHVESQKNCGELGWSPLTQMYPEFQQAIAGAAADELIGPVLSPFGIHILRLLDREDGRAYSLQDDWDTIKQMARQEKTNRVVAQWIDGIRQDTFIEIRQY